MRPDHPPPPQTSARIDAEYAPGEANAAFRTQFGLQGDKTMN
jgi:hypothetical protein